MKKAVLFEGNAVNPGDISWKPVTDICKVEIWEDTAESEKLERIGDAEIIFNNKLLINDEVFSNFPNIKYVGICATGYNVVDLEAARRHGVIVTNVPAYSTDSVAQHTWALILEIVSMPGKHDKFVHDGGWTASGCFTRWISPITELSGLTLGVYGFGNIGRKVSEIARAFGMKVLVYTKNPAKYSEFSNEGLHFVDEENFYANSDIISYHCPLTSETVGIVNAETISRMKRGVIIINVSRGGILNESDLANALISGRVAAAGVDVVSQEPITEDNPLLKVPNIYITPHIAWSSVAARKRLVNVVADNLRCWLEGKPQNVVV